MGSSYNHIEDSHRRSCAPKLSVIGWCNPQGSKEVCTGHLVDAMGKEMCGKQRQGFKYCVFSWWRTEYRLASCLDETTRLFSICVPQMGRLSVA